MACRKRGGATQPDWNQNDPTADDYIKNRPFYSELITVEWDGDTTGKTVVDFANGAGLFCKISDLSPTIGELIGGKVYISSGEIVEITPEHMTDIGIGCASEMFVSIKQTGTWNGITFPEVGIYFIGSENVYVSKLEYENDFGQIDQNFISYVVFNTDIGFSTVSCNTDNTSLFKMLSNNKLKNAFLISPEFCASMSEIVYNNDDHVWLIKFYINRLRTEVSITVSDKSSMIYAENTELQSIGNHLYSMLPMGDNMLILKSSTPGSKKSFRITVDDTGTISARVIET